MIDHFNVTYLICEKRLEHHLSNPFDAPWLEPCANVAAQTGGLIPSFCGRAGAFLDDIMEIQVSTKMTDVN